MKKLFFVTFVIAFISFMSMGCMTTILWSKKQANNSYEKSTKEKINSFLITQDSSKIIFISDSYHYVLNSDKSLLFLLKHKDEVFVQYELEKGNYTIISNNDAQAIFNAKLDLKNCNEKIVKELIDNKYGIVNNKTNIAYFKFELNGTRYKSDKKINEKLV